MLTAADKLYSELLYKLSVGSGILYWSGVELRVLYTEISPFHQIDKGTISDDWNTPRFTLRFRLLDHTIADLCTFGKISVLDISPCDN